MKTIKHRNNFITIRGDEWMINPDGLSFVGNQAYLSHLFKPVEYPAPYERNDRFILLRNEADSSKTDVQLEPESGHLLYADVDFEYNYYAADYELYSSIAPGRGDGFVDTINQYAVPSLNLWLLNEKSKDLEDPFVLSSDYEQTYNFMYTDTVDSDDGIPLSKDYFNKYFYEIADNIGGLSDIPTVGIPGLEMPQFINKEIQDIYFDRQNVRESYPMFSKIKLTGMHKSEFCRLLEQAGLEEQFIDFLQMHRFDYADADSEGAAMGSTANLEFGSYGGGIGIGETPEAGVGTPPAGQQATQGGSEITHTVSLPNETHNISNYTLGYHLQDFYDHIDDNHSTSIATGQVEDESSCEFFENFIKNQIFRTRIDELRRNSPRQTTLPAAFRLEKRNEYNTLLFVKYFFNYEDLLEFKLYDSQIIYGKTYTYEIRVINAILRPVRLYQGTQYITTNTIIFLEDPYYKETIKILDSPPIAPDVELITYRGIDNKVLILLNQMVDQKVEAPILINESDWDSDMHTYGGFKDQYLAQGIQEKDSQGNYNPILFESDDPTDFELFKCTKHPTSYDDFRNEHYRVISSGDPKLTAASYEDTILPNQSYYYMFRAQDVHGHVSNPSPIYEFILIKEGETLYPRIRIVDLAQPDPPIQKSKTFKKYLKIGFSPRQYQIPSDQIQNIDDTLINHDVPIGITDGENIIGSERVFKFRIRSKNTGKLIDINVTFKKNKVIKA